MARIYAAYEADGGRVLLAGLLRRESDIEKYAKEAEAEGYEGVRLVCKVPLIVSGTTRPERKKDFLDKIRDLATHPAELWYAEEDEIQEWIETNAARVGAVRELKAMGIL